MTEKLEHRVECNRGYDCVKYECIVDSPDCKPGAGGSHGIHGLTIIFVAKGKKGAVTFTLYTGWMPQKAETDHIGYRSIKKENFSSSYPMPADLGFHSIFPIGCHNEISQEKCCWLDDEPCYYGGSSLNAADAYYALANGGNEGVFKFLDEYYETVFNGEAYPTPCEYPKTLRKKEKKDE